MMSRTRGRRRPPTSRLPNPNPQPNGNGLVPAIRNIPVPAADSAVNVMGTLLLQLDDFPPDIKDYILRVFRLIGTCRRCDAEVPWSDYGFVHPPNGCPTADFDEREHPDRVNELYNLRDCFVCSDCGYLIEAKEAVSGMAHQDPVRCGNRLRKSRRGDVRCSRCGMMTGRRYTSLRVGHPPGGCPTEEQVAEHPGRFRTDPLLPYYEPVPAG